MQLVRKYNLIRTLGVALMFFVVLGVNLAPVAFSKTGLPEIQLAYAVEEMSAGQGGAGEQGGGDPPPEVTCGALNWECHVSVAMITLGGLVSGLGGSLLDMVIEHFVLNMGANLTDTGGVGNVINSSWSVVRDVVNIMFIFGFVYIGIRTILQPSNSNTKTFLAQLVVAALLINFSLFFAKLVIDVANVFALEVYSLMNVGQGNGIAQVFIEATRAPSFFTLENGEQLHDAMNSIGFAAMAMLFLMVAGFIFAAAGIMLVIRYVALIIILIFSPLIVASIVFPKVASMSGNILDKLFAYAFYAPAFLFLVYISFQVLAVVNYGTENGFVDALESRDGGGVILQFVVAMMFLVFSFVLANRMSLAGGSQMVKMGNNVRSRAQRLAGRAVGGATFGLAGALGRSTIGRAGFAVSNSERLKEDASKSSWSGFVARRKLGLSHVAANATYDGRNVAGAGEKIGIGKGTQAGGYKQRREALEKKRTEFADSLGEVKDDDPQVETWQNKVDASKSRVQDLKDAVSTASGADKKPLQGQLRAAEFEQQNYEQALQYEKQRRQIGSADANEVLGTMLPGNRDRLNARFIALATADASDKATRRAELDAELTRIKNAKEKGKAPLSERGYAGVLESSFIQHHARDGHIKPTGKAIRKRYEKQIKRSKEDARTDKLVDSFKKSSS